MFQPLNLLLVTGNILVPIGRGELPVEIQNGLDLADGEPPSEKDQDRLSVEGEERQHAFPAQDLRPPRRGYVRPGRRNGPHQTLRALQPLQPLRHPPLPRPPAGGVGGGV